jgi:hypothetical protein
MSDLFMRRTAEISACGRYRHWLERQWDRALPVLVVCMLNPSTADDQIEDPTLRELIRFAKLWGYGGLIIVNLYAWRSSSPALMRAAADRSDNLNHRRGREAMISAMTMGRGQLLVAWGNDGDFEGEASRFAEFAADQVGCELICLGTTQSGAPKHPMARGKHRIPRDQQPIVWRKAA